METLNEISAFITRHEAVLGLLALAFIVTMPEALPPAARQIPAWLYGWLHDGLKTFVSFRSPRSQNGAAK